MCMSCGCGDYEHRHPGSHSIVWSDLQDAAEDAGISPKACAWNIVRGTNAMGEPDEAEKARDDAIACNVFKSSDERRYTLGVAYPATRADVGKAADGFRDFASSCILEDAAWSYLRKGGRVGLDHRAGTDGAGTVVESYIWRGPDWPQENGYVVKAGDWLLGVLWSPEAWADIKAGKRTGFSPQGAARRRKPSPEALAALR